MAAILVGVRALGRADRGHRRNLVMDRVLHHQGRGNNATYSQVEEGLYVGGCVDVLPDGTQAVLNLCERPDPYYDEVIYQWSFIQDTEPAPSLDWLREQVEFVDRQRQAGRKTFIHCRAGVSRSGMVTLAYLMHKNGWGRDEGLRHLREKRPVINPNPAFMALLLEWESRSQ